MTRLDKVILDADVCFKLGRYTNYNFIEKLIPCIAKEVYIHEYVYEAELLTSDTGKPQIDKLIRSNDVLLLKEDELPQLNRQAYDTTVKLLCKAMKGQDFFYDKVHKGEIVSLAMAKVYGIPIFMTNESSLQPIINSKLNTGMDEDIHVFRLIDIMHWIKDNPKCEISRKEAKLIWLGAYDRDKLEHYKQRFDNEIWNL